MTRAMRSRRSGAVFTLARFSEAFLVLRAQGVGLRPALIPLVLIVMNIVYAAVCEIRLKPATDSDAKPAMVPS